MTATAREDFFTLIHKGQRRDGLIRATRR